MKKVSALVVTLISCIALFAGEISMGEGARLDIVSRTSFGVDIDNPWRYGLKNELTKFTFAFSLAPYQKLTNRVNAPDAVGFIDITLFHLDLIRSPSTKPNGGGGGYNAPANIGTNRFQTGEFIAGIAKGNWLIQLNAGGNEPFISPWNKGMQFLNDGIKLSWAYLDSMIDAVRTKKISDMTPIMPTGFDLIDGSESTKGGDGIVSQFQQDGFGLGDRMGMNQAGNLLAVMYNRESFGLNFKLATEKSFDSSSITEDDKNGIAAGIDAVIQPDLLPGLQIFVSAAGTCFYGIDASAKPIMGGANIGYTIPLNEDISIQPYAGFDIGIKIPEIGSAEKVEFEAAGGVVMRWPGQGGWFIDYIRDSEGRVFPGMALAYKVYGTSSASDALEHSIKFTLFEPKGDDGVLYGLGSEIILDFVNISSDSRSLMATAYVDYTMFGFLNLPGAFIPWAIICYDNLLKAGSGDRIHDLKIDVGVKLENTIANTTFGIGWHSGSLIQKTNYRWGYFRATVEIRL
ncbi:MAG: hypothetical protein LBU99_02225 [Spirochaetaceae bacterium]|jgi:hypothetical protein|nr:hypothetical protein [Spirochaetaceae bacterium]